LPGKRRRTTTALLERLAKAILVEELALDTKVAKIGEEVYGLASFYRDGSAPEFIAIHADDLAAKPKTLDHVQAAAVPLAALTAWQALFSHAMLTRGQRVQIHGGAGRRGKPFVSALKIPFPGNGELWFEETRFECRIKPSRRRR
jgi:hypothetical protein